MKTVTTQSLKTLMQAPIGGAAVIPAVKVKPAAKVAAKVETKGKRNSGLYRFMTTPGGDALRAMFIALIGAQIGKELPAGKEFKLWPGFPAHHRNKGNLGGTGSTYTLTAAGARYFKSDEQKADADLLKVMAAAIKSGQTPKGKGYGAMVVIK